MIARFPESPELRKTEYLAKELSKIYWEGTYAWAYINKNDIKKRVQYHLDKEHWKGWPIDVARKIINKLNRIK